ncbi:MAG: TIGR02302 family protein [Methylobacterium sp.]|uniref:TIGR02302 family protein n=1 Tax=Methylobacterium sp. TaxID=409 RepID=UPI0025E02E4A|nr:TIGR02302 family protein [Methylobacterium sp.]MBX9932265.1 TIGR02302 family protein [Methylobacterium sp.]
MTLPNAQPQQDAVRDRLDRLVARAKAASLWERTWPVLWRGLAVLLAFLAVSWLGLWLDLGPLGRMIGLALFAAAFVAGLVPLAKIGRPTRREALARIDRDAASGGGALAHSPASSIDDTLAVGTGDPATQALWALHRKRAAAAVAKLSVAVPRPAMPRRDPFALRAALLVTVAASLFVAGSEWRQRVGAAFDWRAPAVAGPNFRVDGWIDPPLYTRMPPLVVALGGPEQRLRAPVNSTLIVRIAGLGEARLSPRSGLEALPGKDARPDLREDRFKLTGGLADLTVETTGGGSQRLVIETIPDEPPVIRSVGTPEVNGRGTFNLSYRAKDDYGIASAEGVVEPLKPGRSLVPPPRIPLALPGDATGEADAKTLVDLTDNPWSGARVRFTLVVKDEAEQEARSQSVEMTLPARPFQKPLARSLAEERRRLVTAPDESRRRVQTALDALLIAPSQFTPEPGIFLGLRTASRRLKAARTDEALTEVADLLWEMALKIEDGDLSDAEKSLRAAQDRLKEAIERGAPDEEVKKLTEDLKQALDKFMKEMAQRQGKEPGKQGERSQQDKNAKSVTPDDLNKMIEDMAEAMKRGDTAEAQRLLEQLRGILENLQSAEQGGKSDPRNREMNKQAQELDEMAREQQGLRDETFKDGQSKRGQQRPRNGQQGQQQPGGQGQQGQGQQGQGQAEQGQQGQGQGQKGQKGQGGTGQRQQALRERLEDLQRRMKELGMQGEEGLSEAEEAMREAEGALGQGREGDAVDAQGRALDGLKRGAEGMQQQMQEMAEGEGEGEGQQEGGKSPSQQGQAGSRDDDPLGRPTKGRDLSGGNVRVPTADESGVQRTRRILEELRRKLGDPSRSREELDYFERLLRRN